MSVSTLPEARTVEDIIGGLKEHVWTLLRASRVDAAMVLLEASLEDFLRATAEAEVRPEVQPDVQADVHVDVIIEDHPTAKVHSKELVIWGRRT